MEFIKYMELTIFVVQKLFCTQENLIKENFPLDILDIKIEQHGKGIH